MKSQQGAKSKAYKTNKQRKVNTTKYKEKY